MEDRLDELSKQNIFRERSHFWEAQLWAWSPAREGDRQKLVCHRCAIGGFVNIDQETNEETSSFVGSNPRKFDRCLEKKVNCLSWVRNRSIWTTLEWSKTKRRSSQSISLKEKNTLTSSAGTFVDFLFHRKSEMMFFLH